MRWSRNLPVGVQQRVEIIKALSRDAGSSSSTSAAVLTPGADELMAIMRQLRDEGTAIVFITHKLREARGGGPDHGDPPREGRGGGQPESSNTELASLMVGRAVELTVQKDPPGSARADSRCAI